MVVSLTNKIHVYPNDGIVAFLYDREECKPTDGAGDHRCDVILIDFLDLKEQYLDLKQKLDLIQDLVMKQNSDLKQYFLDMKENLDLKPKIWLIERKGKVDFKTANKAIEQIEGCNQVIAKNSDWDIIRCIIGESYGQDAVRLLDSKKILHLEFNKSNSINNKFGYVLKAVEKIK